MFNNPFDSFHNTVAEAKEEREQLDRLLTISTPRERLLVAVIALLLFFLAVWLVFGNIDRSLAVKGVLVGSDEKRSVQALLWVQSDTAPQIKPGLPATVELTVAEGETETFGGKIATISVAPLSERLAPFQSKAPVFVYRVDIALDRSLDSTPLAGKRCRVIIELGRQSPIAFLHLRQP